MPQHRCHCLGRANGAALVPLLVQPLGDRTLLESDNGEIGRIAQRRRLDQDVALSDAAAVEDQTMVDHRRRGAQHLADQREDRAVGRNQF
jgi:hypothetical protein